MTDGEVAELRKALDDIKVRGKDVPRPIKNWAQCGLSNRVVVSKAALSFVCSALSRGKSRARM